MRDFAKSLSPSKPQFLIPYNRFERFELSFLAVVTRKETGNRPLSPQRGDYFYDITKIRNITDGDIGRIILKHDAESVSDVSNNSIPQNSEKVNSNERNS